jgi:hypothetical protein
MLKMKILRFLLAGRFSAYIDGLLILSRFLEVIFQQEIDLLLGDILHFALELGEDFVTTFVV